MAIKSQHLAQTVTSWAQFEVLCGRQSLLSEASLAQPIGQFLKSRSAHGVLPQEPHPALDAKRRPKVIDFAVRRPDGSFSLALETKWINNKRDVKQEVLDDLARLELVYQANRQTQRLLLVAGDYIHISARVLSANVGKGANATSFVTDTLPVALGNVVTVDLGASTRKMHRM